MTQRVLITGAASGLGAALAAAYARRGAQLLVTDRSPTPPDNLPDGASYLPLDVTSDADWQRALSWATERWDGLDILVNNAGVAAGGRVDTLTVDDWRWVTEINLFGVVRGCRTFTPLFKSQGHGHLVNTASLAGLVHPPAMSSYNAVKAAVVALSETLRHELEPHGVTCSVVCPSFFRTNLARSLPGSDPLMETIATKLITRAPHSAEEIAARVLHGVDRRRPMILTDRAGRRAYWAKRLLSPLYHRQMRQFGARVQAEARRTAARSDTTTPDQPPGAPSDAVSDAASEGASSAAHDTTSPGGTA
ncbi:SDR family NAD(P)-dependent oxidoreductase [Streptomyces sp. NPDC005438]|uniref:SDR family NAD(P)-dependent oxidoreductase n=1 Tax=Streptomyces sp. NPDC005438 TaxID=3156880 RepID=UPI0033B30271